MSGGFFRGTSADQDTRFSNKQAKLLKSQKFAPELENLVDMTKVQMDVMRPWIACRATELLGFEDEVLINFIYGLLDKEVVNGKEIQIQLTGFMEKNTGKFMRELWMHLLSAQKNASGVPQQFLDDKEEETRKKKAETDHITSEIQRKELKENREREQEKMNAMDGEVDILKANNAALEPSSRHQAKASRTRPADEKEANEKNGSRGRNSRRPSRSGSKSSDSTNHSNGRRRSRSVSGSPQPVQRSISSERMRHSPSRRSLTLRRRRSLSQSASPPRRGSHFRRRSVSRSRRSSPSPVRRRLRSPIRRRSRSPIRRRSRSSIQRRSRSPIRRRSRSPVRRRSRSPMRRRARSPVRYRSRSPMGHRSQSPLHPRSPSPSRRRSPSPMRRRYRRAPSTPRRRSPSPMWRTPTFHGRRRSPSPGSMSPLPQERTSQSPIRGAPTSPVGRRSPVRSPRNRLRAVEKNSPVRQAHLKERTERPVETGRGSGFRELRPPASVRSPQRDPKDRNGSSNKVPPLSSSPYNSGSPPPVRRRSPAKDRRSRSPYESPVEHPRKQMISVDSPSPGEDVSIHDSPESVVAEEISYAREREDKKAKSAGKRSVHLSTDEEHKALVEKDRYKNEHLQRPAGRRSGETRISDGVVDLRRKEQKTKSENDAGKVQESPPTFSKERARKLSPVEESPPALPKERARKLSPVEEHTVDERSYSYANDIKGRAQHHESGNASKSSRKVEGNDLSGSVDSGSEESDEARAEVNEKRKHKRSKRKGVASDDDYGYDSHTEERKEAKRRRKEEKRLKKEERRRRREERRRRKEGRHAEKLKLKSVGNATPPSDPEPKRDGYASNGEDIARRDARPADIEEAVSEQKKLEIALRKRAIESLRAKKSIGH